MGMMAATSRREPLVQPMENRQDWYWISDTVASEYAAVPGIHQDAKTLRYMAHRSLISAFPALAPYFVPPEPQAGRDEINTWKLRNYQKIGRDFVASRRGSLLADSMRMGKTITVLFSHDPSDGPVLVTGPLQARDTVWMTWFKRLWPDKKAVALTGRTYDREAFEGADCIFVHFDVLPAWQSIVRIKPALFIIDEAHVLSKASTTRTQVAKMISTASARTVAVTGTPLWNKPSGLFNILACAVPGAFGGYKEYAERYCDGRPGQYGMVANGVSNADEFQERLKDVMLRRSWVDVADELPSHERNIVAVDVSEAQVRKIDLLSEQIHQASKTRKRTHSGELACYRRLTGSLKVGATVELATKILSSGDSVVIWTWHKDVAKAIHEKLPDSFQVDGDTPTEKREEAYAKWRSVSPAALILTLGVGQSAIDLSHARQAIFVEIDFTPAVVAQAEMRPFSINHPLVTHYLYVNHLVDRRLIQTLVEKCGKAAQMGTPAAESAIEVLREAFDISEGSTSMEELRNMLVNA